MLEIKSIRVARRDTQVCMISMDVRLFESMVQ